MNVWNILDLVFVGMAMVSGFGVLISLVLYAVVGRAHNLRSDARDTLILAAHPDDCVIAAGEYGVWAIESGKHVRIIYLTSGDLSPYSKHARIREAEAMKVWQRVGVSPEDIMFLRLPNSPLRGPSLLNQAQVSEAERQIALAIASMPPDAAVFLPASDESHQDHRTLRSIALAAAASIDPHERILFECPEYNSVQSLVRAPIQALLRVSKAIPLMARVVSHIRTRPAATPPGFSRPVQPPHGRESLETKKEMLRGFASEDGEKLVRLFGWHDQYIPTAQFEFSGKGRIIDMISMVALWGFLLTGGGYLLARFATMEILLLWPTSMTRTCAVAIGVTLIAFAFRRSSLLQKQALYALSGLGILVTALSFS